MVNEYKAVLLAEEKAVFDGRVFGEESRPIFKNIVCLAYDSENLPTYWQEIYGLNKCTIAPGSIAIHPNSKSIFMSVMDGSWVLWSGGLGIAGQGSSDTSEGGGK